MRADIHDGQEHKRSVQGPDTEAQDLSPPNHHFPLATRGRSIQKRKTYHLQIITFRLQRAAGPYSRATSGLMRCSKQDRYSMTSSAMASSDGGTLSPSILAVSALMTSSNFDACITGKSAGRLR